MLVTYEVDVKSGTALQVVDLAERLLAELREWRGCLDARVAIENGSDTLLVFQRWASPEELARFLAWRREDDRPNLLEESGFLSGSPVRRTFKEL